MIWLVVGIGVLALLAVAGTFLVEILPYATSDEIADARIEESAQSGLLGGLLAPSWGQVYQSVF